MDETGRTETETETSRTLKSFPPYGSLGRGDTCPTCRGSGRIPRGHEDQLVAVIPCNDVRLKPRRTSRYVCASMLLCLLLCCAVLFFLFPRGVSLTPVSVLSVQVFFTPDAVELEVTNCMDVTNHNYVPVRILDFSVQGLIGDSVVGKTRIGNLTALPSRSRKSYVVPTNLSITDDGLMTYCKSSSIKIHTLFLQLTLDVSYLAHSEQLSLETFEYIDCGSNSTVPHPITG
uniref:Transmembrane protein 106B-like n=1 Tax=Salarias fasciatus TaxID=181472 RepID=A0A672HVG5_SALFA